jgi:DNA polymerase
MSFIVLDFETYYEKTKYTLKALTYEQYIFNEKFKVQGVGIKVDNNPTVYYSEKDVEQALTALFTPGNEHTLLCHNTMFDGAILSWHYNLKAQTYYCTKAMVKGLFNFMSGSLENICIRLWPDDETKRKGKELESFAGKWDLSPEEQQVLGGYCINDVNLTFDIFAELYGYFPKEELATINNTLRMFIHPSFVTDVKKIEEFIVQQETERLNLFQKSGTPCVVDKKTGELKYPVLSSSSKFAAHLKETYGIVVEKIPSPTETDPENEKYPFAKNAEEFLALRDKHPELIDLWNARIRAASNLDITRARRMIEHTQPSGRLAMPLQYAAAHTLRWGGTNKLNPQNFRRGSPLRKSLTAPEGYLVVVRDLSNIEGRMLAWWAKEVWKCIAFAEKRDLYNELASKLFNRKIERNRTEVNPETGEEYHPDFVEGFVGKTCELGLGYQMSHKTLRSNFAVGTGGGPRLNFEEDKCYGWVQTWRHENSAIVTSWREAQDVIGAMCAKNTYMDWRNLKVEHNKLVLPNGMALHYSGLRMTMDSTPEWPKFEYWNGKYWTSLYGGKLVENIIQALARIVIAENMRKIDTHLVETYGGDSCVALTVHDEVVAIVQEEHAEKEYDHMGIVMSQPPAWCNDGLLVLDSKGGIDNCYSK